MSLFVFFFKQKTAYEMRISDWSSDVCSSDLRVLPPISRPGRPAPKPQPRLETATLRVPKRTVGQASAIDGDTIESHGTAIRLTVANEGMAGDHVLQQEKRCVDDQAPEQQAPGPTANSPALAAPPSGAPEERPGGK